MCHAPHTRLPGCISLSHSHRAEFWYAQEYEASVDKETMERAVSGGGYESDDDDTDAAMEQRVGSSGQHAAAIIALAVAPDG